MSSHTTRETRSGYPTYGLEHGKKPGLAFDSSENPLLIDTAGATQLTVNTTGVSVSNLAVTNPIQTGSAGGALSRRSVIGSKASIADNTATDIVTVTIPNAVESALISIKAVGVLGAGGAVGAGEGSKCVEYLIPVVRTAGAATVAVASSVIGSTEAKVSGASSVTFTLGVSSVTGANSAQQTLTIQATIAHATGSSTNHSCYYEVSVLNQNASGITIAAA